MPSTDSPLPPLAQGTKTEKLSWPRNVCVAAAAGAAAARIRIAAAARVNVNRASWAFICFLLLLSFPRDSHSLAGQATGESPGIGYISRLVPAVRRVHPL